MNPSIKSKQGRSSLAKHLSESEQCVGKKENEMNELIVYDKGKTLQHRKTILFLQENTKKKMKLINDSGQLLIARV